MDRIERIFPGGVPKAVGPYSPVTAVGDLIFISGQIPINPETGNIDSEDIEWQAHQCMKNLRAALEGADSNFNLITKTTVLLVDMGVFPKINEVYSSYFEPGKYPARACFAVAALPKGAKIEIEAIAVRQNISESLKKKIKNE
jgi:2-iminobutanoate/2-iminopropanoate deaminase